MIQFKYLPTDFLSSLFPKNFSNDLNYSEFINGHNYIAYTSVYLIKSRISSSEIYKLGEKIKSVKRSTKIELYERIIMAKQIMRDNTNNAINLK